MLTANKSRRRLDAIEADGRVRDRTGVADAQGTFRAGHARQESQRCDWRSAWSCRRGRPCELGNLGKHAAGKRPDGVWRKDVAIAEDDRPIVDRRQIGRNKQVARRTKLRHSKAPQR